MLAHPLSLAPPLALHLPDKPSHAVTSHDSSVPFLSPPSLPPLLPRSLAWSERSSSQAVRIMFPNYRDIHEQVLVRITELPIQDSIRDLRQVQPM